VLLSPPMRITDDTCTYPIPDHVVDEVRSIIMDARTLNGKWIQNAMATIREEKNPASTEILAFLSEYSYTLTTEHKVSEPWYPRALLDLIFFTPLHLSLISKLDTPRLQQLDGDFVKAQPLLRLQSPEELKLSVMHLPRNLDIEHLPFDSARWLLADLAYLQSPVEILLCLGSVLDEICREAEARTDKKSGMAADDILPILVFCLIHTDIQRPNLIQRFLEVYCDESFKLGRLGYCQITFEAAVSDITAHLATGVLPLEEEEEEGVSPPEEGASLAENDPEVA